MHVIASAGYLLWLHRLSTLWPARARAKLIRGGNSWEGPAHVRPRYSWVRWICTTSDQEAELSLVRNRKADGLLVRHSYSTRGTLKKFGCNLTVFLIMLFILLVSRELALSYIMHASQLFHLRLLWFSFPSFRSSGSSIRRSLLLVGCCWSILSLLFLPSFSL